MNIRVNDIAQGNRDWCWVGVAEDTDCQSPRRRIERSSVDADLELVIAGGKSRNKYSNFIIPGGQEFVDGYGKIIGIARLPCPPIGRVLVITHCKVISARNQIGNLDRTPS